jgi:hypothetical protein
MNHLNIKKPIKFLMLIINKLPLVSLVLYMDIMGDFSLPPLVSRDYPIIIIPKSKYRNYIIDIMDFLIYPLEKRHK